MELALLLLPALAAAAVQDSGPLDQSVKKQPDPAMTPPKQQTKIEYQEEGRRPQDDHIRVHVAKFKIAGDWTMPAKELDEIIAPYVNQELTLNQIRAVANLITQYYRTKGYQLAWAYVPAQEVRDGVVEIRVIEGQIGKVLVGGNQHYSAKFILTHIPDVHEKEAFNLTSLERGLLVLNDYPGLSVRALLRPGENKGFVDLYLNVEDKFPVLGSLDYDNFGSPNVSENRYGATIQFANLWYLGHSLGLRAVYGDDEGKLEAFQANYTIPFPDGVKIGIHLSLYDFEIGGPLAGLDPVGEGFTIGAIVSYPMIREREQTLEAQFGIEAKKLEQDMFGITTGNDDLRVVILGLRLDYPGHWAGHWIANLQIRQGLAGFAGGTENGDPDASRTDVETDFTKATLLAYRLQKVASWIFWIARLQAQYTPARLPISEMIALGGGDSVRGYPPFEYLGDYGYVGTFELRFKLPFLQGTDAFDIIQIAGFYDYGKVYRNDPLPGELEDQAASAWGVGLRFAIPKWGSIRADMAWHLGDPDPSDGDDRRFWISVEFFVN